MAKKHRDYGREYKTRIERGLAAGKTRSAARGHPRAIDLPKPPPGPIERQSGLEKALARMKHGESQARAATAESVSVEKLRRYRLQSTTSKRRGRGWVIFDLRPVDYFLASKGEVKTVTLPRNEGTELSAYWRGVDKFLYSNRAEHLEPFVGKGVRDTRHRFHEFETRPNVLRRLDSVGELDFLEIYADVV
jgi:hypothetical protein